MGNIIDEIESNHYKSLEKIALMRNISIKELIASTKENGEIKKLRKYNITVFSYKTILSLLKKHTIADISDIYGLSYNEIKSELLKHKLIYSDFKPSKESICVLSTLLHFSIKEICEFYNADYYDVSGINYQNGIKIKKEKPYDEIISIDDFYTLYCIKKLSLNQISDIYDVGIKKLREIKKEYEMIKPEVAPQHRSKLSDIEFNYIRSKVKLNIL